MTEGGVKQRRKSGLKSGGRGSGLKNGFSMKISKKSRFFQAILKKSIFQDKFAKNFDFLQVISQKFSLSQGKFPKNFDF